MFKQETKSCFKPIREQPNVNKTTAIVSESKEEQADLKKVRAQKTLHRFFHYYCRRECLKPLPKPLVMLINDIKSAKHTDLHSGHYDKMVFDCIEHCRIFNNRGSM